MTPPLILILALISVESGGDEHKIGDHGKAMGCLQITPQVLTDLRRFGGSQFGTFNREDAQESIRMCKAYLEIYTSPRRFIGVPSLEDMARIWVGGPNGWKDPKTKPYWRKVQRAMKAIQNGGAR